MKRVYGHGPFWLVLGLVLLFGGDSLYIGRLSVLAALLHELGHMGAYFRFVGRLPRPELAPLGLRIRIRPGFFTPREELWLAASGPLANLCAAGLALAAMQVRAGYSGYLFAVANLFAAMVNLLPIRPLDGGRIADAVRAMRCAARRRQDTIPARRLLFGEENDR